MKQPKYILKNPDALKNRFIRERGWHTVTQIGKGVNLTYPYVSKIFSGHPVGYKAMTKLAAALGLEMTEIAKKVKEDEKCTT